MSSFSILMRLQIRNRLAVLRGGGLRGTDGKFKTGKLVGGGIYSPGLFDDPGDGGWL